jgi:hypothetical protein
MKKTKVCLVCPVHETPSNQWIEALPNCDIIIVDDSNGQVKIDKPNVRIFDYEKQKELLGKNYEAFEKFHKSSACKNFGHWLAYNEHYDIIIGIDSDCVCPPNFIEYHLRALEMNGCGWENPLHKTGWYPRGYPYSQRDLEVVCNMGLWEDCLDINGKDKFIEIPPRDSGIKENKVVTGMIPFSGMNWACKREFIPYLWFLPNFDYKRLQFRRHDDIFGGYIFQKFLQKKGVCMTYGLPIVKHVSDVNALEDAKNEEAMNNNDDEFYKIIDDAFATINPKLDVITRFKPELKGTKFEELLEGIKLWKKLYNK